MTKQSRPAVSWDCRSRLIHPRNGESQGHCDRERSVAGSNLIFCAINELAIASAIGFATVDCLVMPPVM